MSSLRNIDKQKFEQLFEMQSGYVLNFSNRTFDDFALDSIGREIGDCSSSKANRLRGFWRKEGDALVGKLMDDMLTYGAEMDLLEDNALFGTCRRIAQSLMKEGPVAELDALSAISDERGFETVAKAAREAIRNNEPQVGIDRLHTFVIKYVRTLCTQHGVTVAREKPLHSLFGEYLKRLRDEGLIESRMTELILKSSISVLEAFNDVRNNRTLAHDNAILDYEEALLIFNHVTSSVRFLRSLENKFQSKHTQIDAAMNGLEGIPF